MSKVKVRDSRRPGHFWADNELLDVYGPKIGMDGLSVYMALSRVANNHSGECVITLRQIAEMIGCSPQTAMRAIAKLDKYKLVIIESKGSVTTRQPSIYTLLEVPKSPVPYRNNGNSDLITSVESSVPPSVPCSVPSSVPIGNTLNTINTNNTTNTLPFPETEDQPQKEPKGKTKVKNPDVDPRHHVIMKFIIDTYRFKNGGVSPSGITLGKQLKTWLADHRDWLEKEIVDCIRNRFLSEVNHAHEPHTWVSKLASYKAGPLDKFGNLKGSSNGLSKDAERTHRNRAILARNLQAGSSEDTGHDVPALPDRVD